MKFPTILWALATLISSITGFGADINYVTKPTADSGLFLCPAPASAANQKAKEIREELALYPRELQRIFDRDFLLAGSVKQSSTNEILGITQPDFPLVGRGDVILFVDAPMGTLHHEIFHMLENSITLGGLPIEFDGWNQLNYRGFKYKSHAGGSISSAGINDYCVPGFVSAYATSSAAEDRAETFEGLAVNFPLMQKRMRVDPILKRKVEWLREFLREHFSNSFSDAWFNKMSARNMTQQQARRPVCTSNDLKSELAKFTAPRAAPARPRPVNPAPMDLPRLGSSRPRPMQCN